MAGGSPFVVSVVIKADGTSFDVIGAGAKRAATAIGGAGKSLADLANDAARLTTSIAGTEARLSAAQQELGQLAAAGKNASKEYQNQERLVSSLSGKMEAYRATLQSANDLSLRHAGALREELAAEQAEAGGAAKLRAERELLNRVVSAGFDPATKLGQAYLANLRVEEQLGAETRKLIQANEQLAASERTLHASVAATTAELQQENASMARVLSAFARGPAAVARQRQEEEILNRVKALGVKVGSEETAALERELRERQRLTAAIQQQSAAASTSQGSGAASSGGGLFDPAAILASLAAYFSIRETLTQLVEEVGDGQKAFAQLSAGVTSTGGAAGYTASQLVTMSEGLSRLTGVDDEVIQGAEAILLTFTKIGHEVFPQAQQAALDLSARFGEDLDTSATQLGKALQDPIAGINSLKKVGISFSDEQKRTINSFVETGQMAKAQGVILKELAIEVGGSAAAFRDTLPGALGALRVAWGNLLQDIGNGDLGDQIRAMVEKAIQALDSPEFREKGKQIVSDLASGAIATIQALAGVLKFAADHWDLLRFALIAYLEVRAAAAIIDLTKYIISLARGVDLAQKSILGLNAAWLLSPWGLLTVGLAAVAAGLYVYYTRQKQVREAEEARVAQSAGVKKFLDDTHSQTVALSNAQLDLANDYLSVARAAEESANRQIIAVKKALVALETNGASVLDQIKFALTHGGRTTGAGGLLAPETEKRKRLIAELAELEARQKEAASQGAALNDVIHRLGPTAKGAADSLRDLTEEQGKAAEALAKHIADLQAAEAAAQRLASAAVKGPDSFREQQGKEAILNDLLQQQEALRKVGLSLTQEQVAAITGAISGQRAANDSAQAYLVLWQEIQSTKDNAITQEARLQDAVSGTLDASQKAAAYIEAESKARANGYADNKPYVDLLEQEALNRLQLNQRIDATIKGLERNREVANELAALDAQILDARTQGVAASKAQAIAQLAVSIAIERGTLGRRGELAAIRQGLEQQEAERTLKRGQLADLQAELVLRGRLANARAEVLDFQAGQAAVRQYGGEVAGILQNYGLIGDAVNKLARDQEALNRLHAEGLDESTKEGLLRLFHWQVVVDSEAEALKGVNAYRAGVDIAALQTEKLKAPWIQLSETIQSTLLDNIAAAAAGAKIEWGDMWKSFLQQGIRAGLEWLQQWLRNIAVAKAAEAGLGTGGGASNYGAALAFKPGATTAASGSSAASSAGAAAGYAVIFAIWAKVLTGLYEGFTHKRTQYGQATIGEGGLVRESGNSRLAGQAAEAIRDLVKQVNSLAQEWHLGLVKLTAGSVSIGQNSAGEFIVKTLVDGYGKVFHSLAEAQEYAKVQAIKFADLSNVTSELVRKAIQNSRAVDTAGLKEDVDFAQRLADVGLDDIAKQMRGFLETFVADWKHAFDLFGQIGFRGQGDLSQLGPATSAVLTNFVTSLQGVYDSLTGHKQDAAQVAEAQRVAYNAQRAIIIAQITLLMAEVQARIADYQTMLLVGYGRGGGGTGPGNGGTGRGTAASPHTTSHLPYKGGASGPGSHPAATPAGPDARNPTGDANMAALLAVLDSLAAALLHIAPEIGKGEVKIPRGGGGGNRQETRQNALDHLEELRNAGQSDAMRIYRESTAALADWKKEAKEAKLTQAQLAEGERLIAEQRKKDLRSQAESLAGIGTDFTRQLRDGMTFFADLKKLGRKETGIPDWLRNVMEGKFLDKMKASWSQGVMQLAGISSPFAQIDAQAAELRENLVELAKASGMTAKEVLAASAALDHAAEMAKQAATYQLEDRLFEPLKDLPEWQGRIVELKKNEVELQYEILKAQLIEAGLWEKDKEAWQASHDASVALAAGTAHAAQAVEDLVAFVAQRNIEQAEALANAQRQAASSFTDLVRNLVDSNRRILTGAQSPLGPQERFQTALADYQRTLTAAQGGNSEALGALPGIRDALLSVAQSYFAGGAGEGLSGGFAQLVQRTLQDFAQLAVSPAVEAATLQDLVRRQSTIATDAAAQAHADLISLRQAVIDLNAHAGVGNLYGGSNRFASAPAAPVDRFSAGAPVAPVVPFPVRGGGEGSASNDEMVRELRSLRQEVAALRRERSSDAQKEIADLDVIAEDAADAKRARARTR